MSLGSLSQITFIVIFGPADLVGKTKLDGQVKSRGSCCEPTFTLCRTTMPLFPSDAPSQCPLKPLHHLLSLVLPVSTSGRKGGQGC